MKKKTAKKKRRFRFTTLLIVLIFCVGLSLLLYPSFSNWWNSYHESKAIASYAEQVSGMEESRRQELWQAAVEYNENLVENAPHWRLTDEEEAEYESTLDVTGTGIMGYIEIKKIGVSLTIYHGTSEGVLQTSAGHLEGSSLPVGGESTHCVLSGHRGLPSAKLFTDLDQLELGDTFELHVLDQVLTYEIDQIVVVLPTELSELNIQEGEDLCTLVTCTPYGINSHRMLVRGHRVPTPETSDETDDSEVEIDKQTLPHWLIFAVGSVVLVVLLLVVCLLRRRKKRKQQPDTP